jgi:hypothetical protein
MIADSACIYSKRSLGQRKEPWIGPDAMEGSESLTGSYLAALTREENPPSTHNEINQIAEDWNNNNLPPQAGHVSNFGGLKHGPLEPLQLLSGQRRPNYTGAPISLGAQ